VSASRLDIAELPSVLAIPLAEYRAERDPLLRLWHICDVAEMTLRTLAALAIADWEAANDGSLPDKLRAEVASRIEQPTVGKWRGMLLALTRKPPPSSRVPALYGFVADSLDPLLRGTEEPATTQGSVLELRNRLAHGGGMSRALAARLCESHAPRFDATVSALAWLQQVLFVAPHARGGEGGRLCGSTTELATLDPVARPALERARAIAPHPEAVVALCDGEPLLLWPLVQYGVPQGAEARSPATDPAPQVYSRRGEVRVLFTPLGSRELAVAESGKRAIAALRERFTRAQSRRERWQVGGFERELSRDANRVVGRRVELDRLLGAADRSSGALWVTGPAGIGKSYLMARLAVDLDERAGQDRLVLPYRFKIGDARCSRERFLELAVERLVAWTGAEPSGGRGSLLRRLTELLADLGEARGVVFVLDGLDEVAAIDPTFAEEVPIALRERALWICSGRPERGLAEAFAPDRAEPVFPGGLPGMGRDDTRAMLLEKIGPLSKRLLAADRDSGDEAVNPFIERVLANAGGLPIYVAYVIGDVLSGRLRDFDDSAVLPPSLEAYHAELLRGLAVGSVHQVLTPMLATLALGREALGVDVLHALLCRRGSTTDDTDGRAVVERALAAAASMLRRVSSTDGSGEPGEDAYVLFHLSLRDHLLDARETRVAVATARRALADAALGYAAFDGRGEASAGYLFRCGIAHLIDAGQADEAAKLLASIDYAMARLEQLGPAGAADLTADLSAVARAASAPAAAALAPWRAFFGRRAHLVERGGAVALLQAAIADARTSPITEAAEAWVAAGRARRYGAWLRRLDRPESSGPEQCARTFEGHASRVTSVALHPDGRRAISAAGDATLKLWDLETGACLRTLAERQDSMSFAMVTAVPAAGCLRDLGGHGWTVWSVAMLGDGRRAAAAHGDRTVKIWDVESGACLRSLAGHTGYVWAVAAHPDGRRVLSAGDDRTIRVWDADSGACLAVLDGHEDWVAGVSVTPDGAGALSAGGDGTVRLWDLASGRCLRVLAGHRDHVASVVSSADGRFAFSASGDGTIARWDLLDGRCAQRWPAHAGGAWALALAPADRALLSTGRDGVIHVWDPMSGEKRNTLRGHAAWAFAIAVVDDERAVTASEDKTLKLWSFEAAASARGRASHDGPIHDLAVGPEGKVAVTGSADGTLKLWELESGRSLRTLYGHEGEVRAVGLTADAQRVVSASDDATIRVWRLDTGECVRTLRSDEAALCLALSPGGDRILCGDRAGGLSWWNASTGERTRHVRAHEGALWAVAVESGWRHALSAGADGVAHFWDLERGEVVRTLRGHSWEVQAALFAGDGARAITASRDRSVKLWDLASGRCVATHARHAGTGRALALWPDGVHVLGSADDKSVELWSIEAGTSVVHWPGEAAITAVAPAKGGRIVIGDAAGQVTYLELVGELASAAVDG